MSDYVVHCGDCREVLTSLGDCSVDSIVTDPPYELGFMGKGWDRSGIAYDVNVWRECSRVLKPGGHLLAFGGSRTYHRLACAIEDAGFDIRDQIQWLYGSGFPKSLDVSKAIDLYRRRDFVIAAVEMGFVGPQRSLDDWTKENHAPSDKWWEAFKEKLSEEQWGLVERSVIGQTLSGPTAWFTPGPGKVTAPATEEARQWNGWGTALKPAHEPIVLARKPLEGTVAENVLKHGTGGLNIDGCRIPSGNDHAEKCASVIGLDSNRNGNCFGEWKGERDDSYSNLGRWPANVILSYPEDEYVLRSNVTPQQKKELFKWLYENA